MGPYESIKSGSGAENGKPGPEGGTGEPLTGEELRIAALEPKRRRARKQCAGILYSCQSLPGGPPVDDEKLRKLEREELTEEERTGILQLINTYLAWARRSDEIHHEEVTRYNEEVDRWNARPDVWLPEGG
jgi:hypothetical protein